MIIYEIPGRDNMEIENIVFDYNGTIAVNGNLIDGVKEKILELKELLNIYIVTADTYGTVEAKCKGLGVEIVTFPTDSAGTSKKDIVKKLGSGKTICIGNGFNDIQMFKESKLSIAIIEDEGCSGKLLLESDLVMKSIIDAFNIVMNSNMMKATLRS